MPIYSSLDRLNAMHALFTTQGNGKLDAGEVEALAAFHGGLPASSQSKIHGRMVELYQTSKFSSGQQANMLSALKGQGFTTKELEKADPNSAAGFAKLSIAAQSDRIRELADEYSDEGSTKNIKLSSLDMMTAGKLKAAMNKLEKDIMKEHPGDETFIGDTSLKAIFVKTEANKLEKVGYQIEMPYYADEHDAGKRAFFNLKGQALGVDWFGE